MSGSKHKQSASLISLIVVLFFSGCLNEIPEIIIEPEPPAEDTWRAYSVVAPVDTGINPYHIHFQTNDTLPSWFLDDFGVTLVCDLSNEGSWEERVEADRESCWDKITYDDIVYFEGTRIMGLSHEDEDILVKSYPIGEIKKLLFEKKIINGLTLIALQWFFLEHYAD